MNNTLLCGYTTFYLGILQLVDTWVASMFWLCEKCPYERWCTGISLSACFQFFEWTSRSGIAGSYCNSIFNFLRNHHAGFHSGLPVYILGSISWWEELQQICNPFKSIIYTITFYLLIFYSGFLYLYNEWICL